MRSKGVGPQNLGISNSMITPTPALHTTKRSGKPVGAGHLARHEKGTAHPSVGEVIGRGVNKVKETAKVVNEKVIKPTTEVVNKVINDTKKTINQ